MDRDVLYGLVFSTIALTLFGGYYLTPSRPHVADTTLAEAPQDLDGRHEYSPDDIRYKFEQKAKKQGKRRVHPAAEESAPPLESSESEAPPIDDGGDETAEEPPLE